MGQSGTRWLVNRQPMTVLTVRRPDQKSSLPSPIEGISERAIVSNKTKKTQDKQASRI